MEATTAAPAFAAYHVRLVDLRQQVLAGSSVPITFTFQRAGPVTVQAFVQPSNAPRLEGTACPSRPGTGTPSG